MACGRPYCCRLIWPEPRSSIFMTSKTLAPLLVGLVSGTTPLLIHPYPTADPHSHSLMPLNCHIIIQLHSFFLGKTVKYNMNLNKITFTMLPQPDSKWLIYGHIKKIPNCHPNLTPTRLKFMTEIWQFQENPLGFQNPRWPAKFEILQLCHIFDPYQT